MANKNELATDLRKITTEIKTYQQVAGQSIIEIGRRLSWVKENDLAHGEFTKWLASINFTSRQAERFIKVANEFSNATTSSHLGLNVLYEIATLPEEERQKIHQLESGKSKLPEDMSVRELQDLKRQLKSARENPEQEKREEIARLNQEIKNLEHRRTLFELDFKGQRDFEELVDVAMEASDEFAKVLARRKFTQIDNYEPLLAKLIKLKDSMQLNVQRLDAGLMQNPWKKN